MEKNGTGGFYIYIYIYLFILIGSVLLNLEIRTGEYYVNTVKTVVH